MTSRRIFVVALLALACAACGGDEEPGAQGTPSGHGATVVQTPTDTPTTIPTSTAPLTSGTVRVVDNAYDPAEITVTIGATVVWTYAGPSSLHTVTAANGAFDSHPNCPNALDQCMDTAGETFSFTFSTAGTVSYNCKVHGTLMSGTVVVQ